MTTWDEAKRRGNLAKHGMDFAWLDGFDWESAVIDEDDSDKYGERREVAVGWLGAALCVYVYTMRGDEDHAISLRKAQAKDYRSYARKIQAIHGR